MKKKFVLDAIILVVVFVQSVILAGVALGLLASLSPIETGAGLLKFLNIRPNQNNLVSMWALIIVPSAPKRRSLKRQIRTWWQLIGLLLRMI